jgi:hypothetical protein
MPENSHAVRSSSENNIWYAIGQGNWRAFRAAGLDVARVAGPLLSAYHRRYWELARCMTRSASRSQFESGCSWRMAFKDHINCPNEAEREKRSKHYWDHGNGIYLLAQILFRKRYCIWGQATPRWTFHEDRQPKLQEGLCTQYIPCVTPDG